MIRGAKEVGAHRVELYTEAYASTFALDPHKAREPYILAAFKAAELGLEVNAGHDLDLDNVSFLAAGIPHLKELFIGHASFATPYIWGSKIPSRCIKYVCNRGNLHYFYSK